MSCQYAQIPSVTSERGSPNHNHARNKAMHQSNKLYGDAGADPEATVVA